MPVVIDTAIVVVVVVVAVRRIAHDLSLAATDTEIRAQTYVIRDPVVCITTFIGLLYVLYCCVLI